MSGCLSYCLKRGTGEVETHQKTHDGVLSVVLRVERCFAGDRVRGRRLKKSYDGEFRNTGDALFC